MVEHSPSRTPEWLAVKDIARLWSEETGQDVDALAQDLGRWYSEFLVQNAYVDQEAGTVEDIQDRQVWRDTFAAYCDESGLAKPRFWFAEAPESEPVPEPAPAVADAPPPEADSLSSEPAVIAAPPRRWVRRAWWVGGSLAAVLVIAAGLFTLWALGTDQPGGLQALNDLDLENARATGTQEEEGAQSSDPSKALMTVEQAGAQIAPAPDSVDEESLVLLVERELKLAGIAPGSVDGQADRDLESALVAYQRAQGLPTDGKTSRDLLNHLVRGNLDRTLKAAQAREAELAKAKATPMQPPEAKISKKVPLASTERGVFPSTVRQRSPSGARLVRLVQARLVDMGFDPGSADGQLGLHTRRAIADYQRGYGFQSSGEPNLTLLEHLEFRVTERSAFQLYYAGFYDKAMLAFNEIVRYLPDSPSAYFNRGLAYKFLGADEQALHDYETAIRLDSNYHRAYLDSGNIFYRNGHYREALRNYISAIEALFGAE